MEQVEKMSTSQLIAEQHEDPEVSPIFSRSVSESKVSQNPTFNLALMDQLVK